jgi:hypothetical protein
MNITSMSNRELYKTITGYDYPNTTTTSDESANESEKISNRDSFEYSDDMDFNDKYTQMVITSRTIIDLRRGIEGSIPTKERIATYFGNMAQRLDNAYTEGKFTKDEYDYLNSSIAEQMEHYTACAENTAARREIGYERSMRSPNALNDKHMTKEERQAELQAKIKEYVDKRFKIDRTSLWEQFNAVRYGKSYTNLV